MQSYSPEVRESFETAVRAYFAPALAALPAHVAPATQALSDYLVQAFMNTNVMASVAFDSMATIIAPILVSAGLYPDLPAAVAGLVAAASAVRPVLSGATLMTRKVTAVSASSIADATAASRDRWRAAQSRKDVTELQIEESGRLAMENLMRRRIRNIVRTGKGLDGLIEGMGAESGPFANTSRDAVDDNSRNIILSDITLSFGSNVLLANASASFMYGHRYALVGANGIGKSTFLRELANRSLPVPKNLSLLYLSQELPPSDMTVLNVVLEADEERTSLIRAEAALAALAAVYNEAPTPEETAAAKAVDLAKLFPEDVAADAGFYPSEAQISAALDSVYARMENIDAFRAEGRAKALLTGLGFSEIDFNRPMKVFSGGWRVRASIARALFLEPDVLLCDESTNHLDIAAIIWLQEYLSRYPHLLIVVSHEPSFLDSVCTDTVVFDGHHKLVEYKGMNYTQYLNYLTTTREIQKRSFDKQQAALQRMQKFIDFNIAKSEKLARAAQSRIKAMEKIDKIAAVLDEPNIEFTFPEVDPVDGTILQCANTAFTYPAIVAGEEPFSLHNVSCTISGNSRIGIVGVNGSGKSTLLKLLIGKLEPTNGHVLRHMGLDIAYFSQFHAESFNNNMDQTAVDALKAAHPGFDDKEYRAYLGRYGLTNTTTTRAIRTLSGGQRARLALASMLFGRKPSLLVLDEAGNHLDVASRMALASALNEYQGAILMISHDETLLTSVCQQYWVVGDQTVKPWAGSWDEYKQHVMDQMSACQIYLK